MKSATLHKRLTCGVAPRRCWPTSPRPGPRVCVIVPSKDNASGSSGKPRLPLLWTFSESGGSWGVLKHKQVLEEVYSREAQEPARYPGALSPNPTTGAATTTTPGEPPEHKDGLPPPQQQLVHEELDELVSRPYPSQQQQVEEEPEKALRERIASAACASTSTPKGGRSPLRIHHHHLLQQQEQQQQYRQALQRNAHQHQQQQVQMHSHHRQQQLPPPQQQNRHHYHHHHEQQQQQRLGTGGAVLIAAHAVNGTTYLMSGASHTATLLEQQPQQQQQQEQQLSHETCVATADLHFASQQSPDEPRSQTHQHHQQQQHYTKGDSQQQSPGGLAAAATTAAPTDTADCIATAAFLPDAVAAAPDALAANTPAHSSSIPGSIWILCCISAALTCASCVFNTALPIYMVSELKMSMRSMGMFEGFLEAFSYVVRMCSGVVSDRMSSRKAAITLGFAAGAAAKFGMASAGSVGLLFAGKAVDRLANGIQAAPRDALIGDLSPPGVRSACFGLAQSLRKWGSAVGALAAFFLMKASNNNYQLIFYSATAVSFTACLAFVALVPAHTRPPPKVETAAPAAAGAAAPAAAAPRGAPGAASATVHGVLSGSREFLHTVLSMGVDFYRMLGVISLYALGHINESLLEARAIEVGFGKAEATLVVAAIAAVTFLTAYPLGLLDDRYGAGTTFAVGIGALIAGDLVLLLSGPHPLALFASCLFLGVHWAVIQGPLLSIVSGLAPANLRGTAFGIFYTVMAITAVAANTMYGSIWHTYGANAAFLTSAALMSVVLLMLPYMLPASALRGAAAAGAAAAAAMGGMTRPAVAAAGTPQVPSPLASLTGAVAPLPAAA